MSMERIAELLVRREFEKQGKFLPDKFWNLPAYKRKYAIQCQLAAKFIRTYGPEVIMSVLEKEKWCFSLAAKRLPHLFELEQHKRSIQKEAKQMLETQKSPNVKYANVPVFRRHQKEDFKTNGEEKTDN